MFCNYKSNLFIYHGHWRETEVTFIYVNIEFLKLMWSCVGLKELFVGSETGKGTQSKNFKCVSDLGN